MHRKCIVHPIFFPFRGTVVVVACAFGEVAFILHEYYALIIKKARTDWGGKWLSLGRN